GSVWIAWIRRIVTELNRIVLHAGWPGTRNDGLQGTYFPRFKCSRHSARERQFIVRKSPIGPRIELPICVDITLLLSVERANAHRKRNKIGLLVREVVRSAWEVWRIAVHGKEVAGLIVMSAARANRDGIFWSDGPVLGAAVGSGWSNTRNLQVVNHPSFIPPGFVVDHKQTGDVGEHVDGRPHILGICRQTCFRLQNTRTEPIVGSCPLGPVAVGFVPSLMPGTIVVKTLGSKPVVSSK